jgi:hypothetical protein
MRLRKIDQVISTTRANCLDLVEDSAPTHDLESANLLARKFFSELCVNLSTRSRELLQGTECRNASEVYQARPHRVHVGSYPSVAV